MALTTVSQHVVSVNAIQGTLIADNAITAVHIATNAVSGTLIADNAVTATHIAQNSITVTQLADDAVEADKIADGVITTNHLNKAMISSQTEVTAVAGDFLLIGDTSDSNNLKKIPISGITNLVSSNSISDADSDTKVQVEESSDEDIIRFDVGGTEYMTLTSNGKLNVTEIAHISSGSLEIGNGDEKQIFDASGATIQFQTADTERMRIDSSGNIQIVGGNQMTQGLFFYNGADGHLLSGIRNKSNSSYNDSGGLEFLTSGTSNAAESVKMSIDTQGRVILGGGTSTTPEEGGTNAGLEVVGSASGRYNALRLSNSYTVSTGTASTGILFGAHTNGSRDNALIEVQNTANGGDAMEYQLHVRDSANNLIKNYICRGSDGDSHFNETRSDTAVYFGSQGGEFGGNSSHNLRASGATFMLNSGSGNFIFEITGTQEGYIDANGFNNGSDIAFKENIKDITYGLDTVKQLQPRKFDWKVAPEAVKSSIGFIAQEVESIIPEIISESCPDGDVTSFKGMNYGALTSVLVKAIQEQQTVIDDLKSRIETLEG